MATTTDFTKMFQDMMPAFPMDASMFQTAFRKQADFSEKLSKVAFEAAERSADLQAKWTRETLSRMAEVTKARSEPADYTKAASDFASSCAESASENMASFAEIAKKAQMEAVELMMTAGKTLQENATEVMKKASADVTTAVRKPAAAAAK